MWQIPVFAAEREAGLEAAVRSSAALAYATAARLAEPPAKAVRLKKRALARALPRVLATNEGQPDLHYLKTLLVSVGWNKNDDVFDRLETWVARHSPEDKPFNFEHQPDDIIGHITGNWAVGADHAPLADDLAADELPEKFHILTSAVLYKGWATDELQERMDRLIEEIGEGKWYVSMEALFRGFDYAVAGKDKKVSVLARSEKTAFLTKHLRAYGGEGTYQGLRVGRLLRGITFAGKGLVKKPANPESVIFTKAGQLFAAPSHFANSIAELGYGRRNEERVTMTTATDTTTPAKLKAKCRVLAEKLEKAESALKLVDNEKVKAREDALKAEIDTGKTRVTKLEAELAAAGERAKAADEQAGSWKAKAEQLQKDLEASRAELATALQAAKKDGRVARLKAAYECDDQKAQELYQKLGALDDEQFEAHASYISEKLKEFKGGQAGGGKGDGTRPAQTHKVQDVPTQTGKPAPMGGKPRVVKGSEDDPPLNPVTPDADEGVEKTRASIAGFIANQFGIDGLTADDQE